MAQSKRVKHFDCRRAIIFDFDGTIADSFEYVFTFLQAEAHNKYDFTPTEQRAMRSMSMKQLALQVGVPVWRLVGIYFKGRRVMRAHMEHVQPFAGMTEILKLLHADGYELYIASSNSSRNIRKLLKQQEVFQYFRAVRGGAGFTGKAALIRQLIVRYRLPKDTTWYIGDETGDMHAAKRAGVHSLAVSWGFADPGKLRATEPDAFAEQPKQIIELLASTWKK